MFTHKGPASTFFNTLGYIFTVWLPKSEYESDSREQFETLQEGYDPLIPGAQEDVWIPIKARNS